MTLLSTAAPGPGRGRQDVLNIMHKTKAPLLSIIQAKKCRQIINPVLRCLIDLRQKTEIIFLNNK